MTTKDFDNWCRSFLEIDALSSVDISLNGIQVDRDNSPIRAAAFAVDASLETIRRAGELGADILFVHHGLFWGKPVAVRGFLRERIKLLLDSNIALYACHLPLDIHPQLGNNAGIASRLGLGGLSPFGCFHGVPVGLKGRFAVPVSLNDALARLSSEPPLALIPSGPDMLETAAVVSGAGASDVIDAIAQGIDLFVTGAAEHEIYHAVVESRINFAAFGHYATETYGPRAVAEKFMHDTGLPASFIDLPTGL